MRAVDPAAAAAVLKKFGAYGVAVGLVSPTATALSKSIIDATAPLREFLRTNGIHDFAQQAQGAADKRLIDGSFVTSSGLLRTVVSLYRPPTKSGDPRIWFTGLRRYSSAGDLLAVLVLNGRLYLVNTSDREVMRSLEDPSSALSRLLGWSRRWLSPVARELLGKLREISACGFIKTVRSGDTGVGATLESLLGIASNSRRTPDYNGIEIKASRHAINKKQSKNRVTLFSQVPNWRHTACQPARTVLNKHGYAVDGRKQLYCTVDAISPNSQELLLMLDQSEEYLHVVWHGEQLAPVMVWGMNDLRTRLAEKHPESFWVKAESKFVDGVEYFRYHSVVHTVAPLIGNLAQAIKDGIVTLDLTMSEKSPTAIRDHGYLFKIWPDDLNAIFPAPKTHALGSTVSAARDLDSVEVSGTMAA